MRRRLTEISFAPNFRDSKPRFNPSFCSRAGLCPRRANLKHGITFRAVRIFLLLCLVGPASTATGAVLADRVSASRLSNGLKVLLLENHRAPVATFQVWYRVGSRNEPWGKSGLSHFLEHMMFKGTPRISAEQFTKAIDERGGHYNAFTTRDFTAYFETLRADQLPEMIDLEADRMHNLALREADFQTERKVIMEERRLRTEDDPQAYLMEQMTAAAFQTQPYHWPIIGWPEDLARITLEDLKQYYRRYYVPSNAFIVVVGDFDTAPLLAKIKQAFGSIPAGPSPAQHRYADPAQTGERKVVVERPAQLHFLVQGYHVPNLREQDAYVLEVIDALLSEGKSSRLHDRLVRQEHLALSVSTRQPLLSHDPDLFQIYVEILPGKKVADVQRIVDDELTRLQTEPVTAHELQKAKNQLEADFVFAQDSLFAQAMWLGRFEIALDWKHIDDYIPAVRKVSAQDIQRVAKRYLIARNRTTGILVPQPLKRGRTTAPETATPGKVQAIE